MSADHILLLALGLVAAAGWICALVVAIKLSYAREDHTAACVQIDQDAQQIAILRLQLDSLRNRPFRP